MLLTDMPLILQSGQIRYENDLELAMETLTECNACSRTRLVGNTTIEQYSIPECPISKAAYEQYAYMSCQLHLPEAPKPYQKRTYGDIVAY